MNTKSPEQSAIMQTVAAHHAMGASDLQIRLAVRVLHQCTLAPSHLWKLRTDAKLVANAPLAVERYRQVFNLAMGSMREAGSPKSSLTEVMQRIAESFTKE